MKPHDQFAKNYRLSCFSCDKRYLSFLKPLQNKAFRVGSTRTRTQSARAREIEDSLIFPQSTREPSKSSLWDNDPLPKYGQTPPIFSGKRVQRSLDRLADGRLLNADVNGSFNTIRKVKPDVFEGLKGLPFSPVALDPLRTHDFLQVA
jgi:hypothetical protein